MLKHEPEAEDVPTKLMGTWDTAAGTRGSARTRCRGSSPNQTQATSGAACAPGTSTTRDDRSPLALRAQWVHLRGLRWEAAQARPGCRRDAGVRAGSDCPSSVSRGAPCYLRNAEQDDGYVDSSRSSRECRYATEEASSAGYV